ncbi:MAG: RNase P subunit p30 family protein [Candidatus Thorarchaeota archaeon]
MMTAIDLNVRVPTLDRLDSFKDMAFELGFSGIATPIVQKSSLQPTDSGVTVFSRHNLSGKTLSSVKKQVNSVRKQSLIVTVPLQRTSIVNWAAGDQRIDLFTMDPSSSSRILRKTTARRAASAGAALEISIAPLLDTSGLDRSRIIKVFRETVRIAVAGGMKIVLSSGSNEPIRLRAPSALQHIGLLLGLNIREAKEAVFDIPGQIVKRNEAKMSPDILSPGIEIVKRGMKDEDE